MNQLKDAWPFVAGVLLCEGVGAIAAIATQQSVQTWYPTLAKPFFTPPDWLFAPVWVVLYAAMGIAAALVWQSAEGGRLQTALLVFGAQLLLNGAWSVVFFGMRSITGGLVVIVLLWLGVALTTGLFFPLRAAAGWLFVPYLAWVTYATALNAAIWWMN